MDKWTREEEIIVLDLYCKIPFKSSSKNNSEVIKIANLIGRTPSAVNMKIGNFGSFDNRLKEQGIVGLSNASKLDKEIFYEFDGKWDELAYESKKLIAKYNGEQILDNYKDIPDGYEKETLIKQRVHQQFFRQAVLASYNGACCITGLSNPELLVASHIKPWKDSTSNEKTDPQNGLCLNSLYDKAFDRGFITISDKYEIIVSNKIRDICNGESVDKFFNILKGHKINLPEKFLPQKEYLQYHNDCIYENW